MTTITHTSKHILDKNVKESILVLLVSLLTSVLAGSFLGVSNEILLLLPGLIILIPGSIDLRGSLFSALGSRLSSALHLGSIEHFSFHNNIVKKNISASLTLSVTTSSILGILAWFFSFGLGLETMSIWGFIFVSVIGGIISGLILMCITFAIAFKSFKKGWDPDNVTSPIISSIGDFITIPVLIMSAYLTLMLWNYVRAISIIILLVTISNFFLMLCKRQRHKSIVVQSLFPLLVGGILSSVSGIFLESNITHLVTLPGLLILIPAFIGQNGNIGNIFSSRIATKMHLGEIRVKLNKSAVKEIRNSYTLSFFIFPILAVLTFAMSFALNVATIPLHELIAFTLLAGLIVNSIIIVINFIMAEISYKWNLDPDNIVVPLISGIADIVGVICLLIILGAAGIF